MYSQVFLTSVLDGSGQLHAPGERAPGTHWVGDWVGLSVGLDTVVKIKNLALPEIEPGPSSP
jgi:hypothetical protein